MTTYTHRYLARIILQAETPLAVGSGERDVITDQLVTTDVNGLPYIPGTALAGVLRNALEHELTGVNKLMGYQGQDNDGQGSRLILSHAQMIGVEGVPIDGITMIDWKNEFYKPFQNLPVRQHVRISHQGASEDNGKFDEQVVYKGTRFCFEMELVSDRNEKDKETWNKMLKFFHSSLFRIGGGTRKGFGELKVRECKSKILDLLDKEALVLYLNKTSNLNDDFWSKIKPIEVEKSEDWIKYELHLRPVDFFLFSSGLENVDAKMIPVTEQVIGWNDYGIPKFSKEQILIPASSVKGALAHRVTFHFNHKKKVFADTLTEEQLREEGYEMDIDVKSNENKLFMIATKGNPAVRTLFGYSAKGEGQRGNVIFSDLFKGDIDYAKNKILNHVAIDRFTGGAMDGALFSEEVLYKDDEDYTLTMQVPEKVFAEEIGGIIKDAFELAMLDLSVGILPLGGGTMRGHGCFVGSIKKNGKELKHEL